MTSREIVLLIFFIFIFITIGINIPKWYKIRKIRKRNGLFYSGSAEERIKLEAQQEEAEKLMHETRMMGIVTVGIAAAAKLFWNYLK